MQSLLRGGSGSGADIDVRNGLCVNCGVGFRQQASAFRVFWSRPRDNAVSALAHRDHILPMMLAKSTTTSEKTRAMTPRIHCTRCVLLPQRSVLLHANTRLTLLWCCKRCRNCTATATSILATCSMPSFSGTASDLHENATRNFYHNHLHVIHNDGDLCMDSCRDTQKRSLYVMFGILR